MAKYFSFWSLVTSLSNYHANPEVMNLERPNPAVLAIGLFNLKFCWFNKKLAYAPGGSLSNINLASLSVCFSFCNDVQQYIYYKKQRTYSKGRVDIVKSKSEMKIKTIHHHLWLLRWKIHEIMDCYNRQKINILLPTSRNPLLFKMFKINYSVNNSP